MISTQRYCLFFPLVLCITAITFPAAARFHSADTNRDNKVDLSELLRVIQFYNSDGYHCAPGTEDSYDPGPGHRSCTPHDSDYNPQDWRINLSELLRVIQFYNIGEYHDAPGTEDGFETGPPTGEGEGEGEEIHEVTIMLPGNVPLEMVKVPSGSFMMGRYSNELNSRLIEDPRHQVTFASGFFIGKYEVTQAQWQAVMGINPSNFIGENRPVERITWFDCHDFIQELNALTGQSFRLPAESEWEYAYRAGTTSRFFWGNDLDNTGIDRYAWYVNNSGLVTQEAGGKLPNYWGLYDMGGNVWEWCEDDAHDDYHNAPADGSPWIDTPRGEYRIRRGGSFDLSWDRCRSAYRDQALPSSWGYNMGLRIVADTIIDQGQEGEGEGEGEEEIPIVRFSLVPKLYFGTHSF